MSPPPTAWSSQLRRLEATIKLLLKIIASILALMLFLLLLLEAVKVVLRRSRLRSSAYGRKRKNRLYESFRKTKHGFSTNCFHRKVLNMFVDPLRSLISALSIDDSCVACTTAASLCHHRTQSRTAKTPPSAPPLHRLTAKCQNPKAEREITTN